MAVDDLKRIHRVPTPLGPYNPDRAVLIDSEDGERSYFVVETKATQYIRDLRTKEQVKIRCAEQHFDAMNIGEGSAECVVAEKLSGVISRIE